MAGDSVTSATHEIAPPISEAEIPSPSARPGRPPRAMGKPSSVVTTAEGSPGMRISVAVISPPEIPPTYIDVIRITPSTLVMR